MYAKDPCEDKYRYLINKRECVGVSHLNDPKAFIEYSNDMDDVFKNIDHCYHGKENKILIVFDDMIVDVISNKKLKSLVFVSQSCFKVPKDVKNNSTHFFIMKISNKRELQQIAINHLSDINTKDFFKIY